MSLLPNASWSQDEIRRVRFLRSLLLKSLSSIFSLLHCSAANASFLRRSYSSGHVCWGMRKTQPRWSSCHCFRRSSCTCWLPCKCLQSKLVRRLSRDNCYRLQWIRRIQIRTVIPPSWALIRHHRCLYGCECLVKLFVISIIAQVGFRGTLHVVDHCELRAGRWLNRY